ncbi:hypothetical protein K1719_034054 [Acacia pycnantha]|nr:hypothetical protein K1719_034054 [Acacia pycnantha]
MIHTKINGGDISSQKGDYLELYRIIIRAVVGRSSPTLLPAVVLTRQLNSFVVFRGLATQASILPVQVAGCSEFPLKSEKFVFFFER